MIPTCAHETLNFKAKCLKFLKKTFKAVFVNFNICWMLQNLVKLHSSLVSSSQRSKFLESLF